MNLPYYLEQLDIQSWHEREKLSLSGGKAHLIIHDLLNVQNHAIGHFVIFPSLTTEEESLLNAMLTAIQLKRGPIHEQGTLVELKKPVLMLLESDDTLSSESLLIEPNVPLVRTYHPRELIGHPFLKRQAWNDLKCYMSFL